MGIVATFAGGMIVFVLAGVMGQRLMDYLRMHRAEVWNLNWPRPQHDVT